MALDNFKGFGLFNDVEDKALQAFNRARMMVNIVVDNSKDGKFSVKAAALSGGYLQCVPKGERKDVLDSFIDGMAREGFALGGSIAAQSRALESALNG